MEVKPAVSAADNWMEEVMEQTQSRGVLAAQDEQQAAVARRRFCLD